ncbi:hypothetical protein VP01_391g1 [Puccinia sorghi]|uniref:Uncharacterized protein n=1 Tax=Puccinia sorghi TaxID=27349 RepID=A0A0L6USJ3_9BASI|nr:hypothetical protein VP01_391g1 [Puccinia sorghi]
MGYLLLAQAGILEPMMRNERQEGKGVKTYLDQERDNICCLGEEGSQGSILGAYFTPSQHCICYIPLSSENRQSRIKWNISDCVCLIGVASDVVLYDSCIYDTLLIMVSICLFFCFSCMFFVFLYLHFYILNTCFNIQVFKLLHTILAVMTLKQFLCQFLISDNPEIAFLRCFWAQETGIPQQWNLCGQSAMKSIQSMFAIRINQKKLPNCLQLTCSMLQPSCHPNSTCFHMQIKNLSNKISVGISTLPLSSIFLRSLMCAIFTLFSHPFLSVMYLLFLFSLSNQLISWLLLLIFSYHILNTFIFSSPLSPPMSSSSAKNHCNPPPLSFSLLELKAKNSTLSKFLCSLGIINNTKNAFDSIPVGDYTAWQPSRDPPTLDLRPTGRRGAGPEFCFINFFGDQIAKKKLIILISVTTLFRVRNSILQKKDIIAIKFGQFELFSHTFKSFKHNGLIYLRLNVINLLFLGVL